MDPSGDLTVALLKEVIEQDGRQSRRSVWQLRYAKQYVLVSQCKIAYLQADKTYRSVEMEVKGHQLTMHVHLFGEMRRRMRSIVPHHILGQPVNTQPKHPTGQMTFVGCGRQ